MWQHLWQRCGVRACSGALGDDEVEELEPNSDNEDEDDIDGGSTTG